MPVATETLLDRYARVRGLSNALIESLEPEDMVIQSMPDVSPTRWHLAHTTWFFETFVLEERDRRLPALPPRLRGPVQLVLQHRRRAVPPTAARAALAPDGGGGARLPPRDRPSAWAPTWTTDAARADTRIADVVELGLNHEQQHQELMLTDIKHVLSHNPLHPAYSPETRASSASVDPARVGGARRRRLRGSGTTRPRGRGVRVRQRGAAPPRAPSRPSSSRAVP